VGSTATATSTTNTTSTTSATSTTGTTRATQFLMIVDNVFDDCRPCFLMILDREYVFWSRHWDKAGKE
jgi:hypothetical protein